MPDGQSLEFTGVTKRFGAVTAVSDLSARVEPGRVTGFLGPNGAGKTTTLRILLGLVRATGGHASIGGRRYAELDKPLQTVGAVLEASSFHPGRTGAAHLTIYAQAAGIPRSRVDEALGLVGLGDAGGRKVGGYSLGMRQRLGLAYALLGDPGVLVLDEPANGLDPEGIRWMRGFLRQLAAEGRTVLVSSHLLAEVQQTVDALLIISRGRLVFEGSIDDLADPSEFTTVVDAPDRDALTAALSAAGLPHEVLRSGLTVRGADPTAVGAIAAAAGVALSGLQRRGPALEEVFLDLVNGTRVHPSAPGTVDAITAVAAAGAGVDAASASDGRAEPAAPGPADAATAPETAAATAADAGAAEAAPVAAGVALAAAGDGAQGDGAEEQEAREADESAMTSAELDAEATAAPGAAAALGAAAGAARAAGRDGDQADEPEQTTEAGAEAGVAAEAGDVTDATEAGVVADAVGVAETEPATDAEPATERESVTEPEPAPHSAPEPAVTTGAGFAVAGTGVIDIVTPAEPEPEPEAEPQPGAPDAAPEDADPDVDELGTIDDELSAAEPPDDDDDRPWENYVKTDADVDADAFFASFDAGDAEPADPADTLRLADARSATAPDADPDSPADHDARSVSERPSTGSGTASETKRPDDPDDPAPEAWVPPEAEAFEDAQEAASTPSPDDGHEHIASGDDHEGGER